MSPNGDIQFEFGLPANDVTFKALKFPYPIGLPKSKVIKYELVPSNTYTFDNKNIKTGVSLIFSEIDGFMYNNIEVAKFEYAPVYPKFTFAAPYVFPYRYEIKYNNIDSFKTEIRINLDSMEWIHSPGNLTIFVRDTIGKGYFRPIFTSYNELTNELVANTSVLGEVIIARLDNYIKPFAPILVEPINNTKVNRNREVKLKWSPRGSFASSDYEISDNDNFTTIIQADTNIKNVNAIAKNLILGKKYYWRVRCANPKFISDWSEPYSFTVSESYLSMKYPNGGEQLKNDSTLKFINWEHNISDSVKIELYKNGKYLLTIKDSLQSFTGAYGWMIPNNLEDDSTYQIKISSIVNPQLSTKSNSYFSIKKFINKIEELDSKISSVTVYPNPFSNSAKLNVSIFKNGKYILKLYNLLGEELGNIFEGNLSEGTYQFETPNNLMTGTYYYVLQSGNIKISGTLIKMEN